MQDPRIRGQNQSKSDIRGNIAETAVCEYFKNRGHEVKNVAGSQFQYDLEVSGIGRVQVKSVHIQKKKARTSKRCKTFSTFLGSSTAGWYAADAFDVLALVWTPNDTHYVVLVSAKELVSQRDMRRMVSTIHIGMARFRNMMEPVVKSELTLLW
jgi:hypothetical protein